MVAIKIKIILQIIAILFNNGLTGVIATEETPVLNIPSQKLSLQDDNTNITLNRNSQTINVETSVMYHKPAYTYQNAIREQIVVNDSVYTINGYIYNYTMYNSSDQALIVKSNYIDEENLPRNPILTAKYIALSITPNNSTANVKLNLQELMLYNLVEGTEDIRVDIDCLYSTDNYYSNMLNVYNWQTWNYAYTLNNMFKEGPSSNYANITRISDTYDTQYTYDHREIEYETSYIPLQANKQNYIIIQIIPYEKVDDEVEEQLTKLNINNVYINEDTPQETDMGRSLFAIEIYDDNPTKQGTLTGTYFPTTPQIIEIVDIPSIMFNILTMPFTFISGAFNLTLFPGNPYYSINISNLFLTIIGISVFIWIIKRFKR